MTHSRSAAGAMFLAVVLSTVGPLAGHGRGWGEALAASSQGQAQLNAVINLLKDLNTVYGARDIAAARKKYGEAKASWTIAAPKVTKKEAQELQELFETLGEQLKSGASAADVGSTVSDMIDELREDLKALPK